MGLLKTLTAGLAGAGLMIAQPIMAQENVEVDELGVPKAAQPLVFLLGVVALVVGPFAELGRRMGLGPGISSGVGRCGPGLRGELYRAGRLRDQVQRPVHAGQGQRDRRQASPNRCCQRVDVAVQGLGLGPAKVG